MFTYGHSGWSNLVSSLGEERAGEWSTEQVMTSHDMREIWPTCDEVFNPEVNNRYYSTLKLPWKLWFVESVQSIYNSMWSWHDNPISAADTNTQNTPSYQLQGVIYVCRQNVWRTVWRISTLVLLCKRLGCGDYFPITKHCYLVTKFLDKNPGKGGIPVHVFFPTTFPTPSQTCPNQLIWFCLLTTDQEADTSHKKFSSQSSIAAKMKPYQSVAHKEHPQWGHSLTSEEGIPNYGRYLVSCANCGKTYQSVFNTYIYPAPEILKNSNFPNSSSTSTLVSNWKWKYFFVTLTLSPVPVETEIRHLYLLLLDLHH